MIKNKLLRKLYTICIITTLSSCENYYYSSVVNNTSNDITVKVKFDYEKLEKHWNGKSYIPYLESAIKEGGTVISFDTIKLESVIKLKPSEEFLVDGGLHHKPDFELIKEIEIYSGDTLILKSRKENLTKLFSTEQKGDLSHESGGYNLVIN